jgi:hypothetical protein
MCKAISILLLTASVAWGQVPVATPVIVNTILKPHKKAVAAPAKQFADSVYVLRTGDLKLARTADGKVIAFHR